MTPGGRAAAAIEILDAWAAGAGRAERLLRDWGRAHRFAGSKDRRAIADLVHECLRRRRSLGWRGGGEDGRALVLGLARAEGWDAEALFSGEGHAPPPLTADERAAAPGPAPDPVALDHPDWLEGPLKRSLGPAYAETMRALARRAPVDLRVNRLKATPAAARARLAEEGVDAAPVALDPDALRAPPGARVAATGAYRDGWVELQDAASQAAARLAAARPGETVLDYCAGGGGKALAFAAHLGGRGRVIAHDAEPGRMADLPARAARAGARIDMADGAARAALGGACDLVFVDAPCSGSGSWRRDPEGKWRLTPEGLAALVSLQREILEEARACLRPGGRLAYAVCSILDEEGPAQADAFAEAHPDLAPGARLRLLPGEGSDGFFCQVYTAA